MTLREWLRREKCSVKRFAHRIGESESSVRKWVYRQRQPTLTNAIMLEDATDGEVTVRELLADNTAKVA